MDVAPTLLGLLNTSYVSRFYGRDVLNDPEEVPRALIGTYQKVALMRDGTTLVRSEEHTSELQSQFHLVCRLLLEKKKKSLERPTLLKKSVLPLMLLNSKR